MQAPPKKSSQADYHIELFAAELGACPTIDLHHYTIDLAIHELEQFIDRAFLQGEDAVKIIHGRGTGRLRQAIHAWLKKQTVYVAAFQDAQDIAQQGAVTVVALRK